MLHEETTSPVLTVETNKIRAAMECAATGKNESRYYLKGVLFEIAECGDIHFVSTDGERMFVGRIPAANAKWENGKIEGARQFILPSDALKQALKHKRQTTWIKYLGEGIFVINGITCMVINGTFPVWRNVVNLSFPTVSVECDWGRVASVEKALRDWSGNKTATVRVHGRGENIGALVTGDDHNAFALVMPQKKSEITPLITPNLPAPYQSEKV
jgi:hypothetical protein